MISNHNWFALYVRTKYERTVGERLRDKGYLTYVPVVTVSRRWADRAKLVNAPLFPNYVFCRLDPANRLHVMTTPDVYCIVGSGKNPVAVPDEEINAIERVVLHGEAVRSVESRIDAGQRVLVISGPLSGVEGTVVREKGSLRLVVNVTLLQRGVTAEVSRESVQLIDAHPSLSDLGKQQRPESCS